jgi:hypothetical protein
MRFVRRFPPPVARHRQRGLERQARPCRPRGSDCNCLHGVPGVASIRAAFHINHGANIIDTAFVRLDSHCNARGCA